MDAEKHAKNPGAVEPARGAPAVIDPEVPAATPSTESPSTSLSEEPEADSPSNPAPEPSTAGQKELAPAPSPDSAAPAAAPTPAPTPAPSPSRPRDLRVFKASSAPFDPRRLSLPDDFYAPTSSDVRSKMYSLQGAQSTDAPMMTKRMRDAAAAEKMSRFRKVLIRVRLPDRVAIQGTFEPKSTVRDVMKFVNAALRDPKAVKFNLFVTPPKTVLKNLDATLWSEGLVPAALVNLGVESGPSTAAELLSDEVLGYLEDAPAQGAAANSTTAPPVAPESGGKLLGARGKGKAGGASKRVPKWFKAKK